MSYYVYAAYPNQWATVHKGDCPHCNEGRGQEGLGGKLKTTDWLGPYTTREEAFDRARSTGLRTVTGGGHCHP
jgi:hypothetical protein